MIDFTLTDEQKDLRELAHHFSEKEIRPVAWDYDRDATWPQEIIDKAFDVGLMNVHIPEAYGGPDLDTLSGCLIDEELGWGCSRTSRSSHRSASRSLKPARTSAPCARAQSSRATST